MGVPVGPLNCEVGPNPDPRRTAQCVSADRHDIALPHIAEENYVFGTAQKGTVTVNGNSEQLR